MKNKVRLFLISCVTATAMLATVSLAGAATTLSGAQALSSLFSGNNPFILGNFSYLSKMAHPGYRNTLRNPPAGNGQSPYAIVLGCSDSRVPPEIIFDKGLGEVFPIRVAGNIIADHEIGSIEYAVEHLCAPSIVILGHTSCGAVTATVDHVLANVANGLPPATPAPVPPAGPYINTLVNTLLPPVVTVYNANPGATRAILISLSIVENVKYTAADLLAKSTIVKEAVEVEMPQPGCVNQVGKKAELKGALYDVNTGKVTLIPLGP